ncbi:Glucan 1,3-beta-glucosidase [Orchesella cincta]|uniref:Glucan 1,3-beta-glucosidase n=1 Tax=Orchesella cincta TaxID=48709 RepID=A0A1D2MEH9_ORCCI|nr:Glucan 1,3-beta-glucosidase [Orchesella cincta]
MTMINLKLHTGNLAHQLPNHSSKPSLDDPTYAHCNGRPQCEMSYSIVAKRSSNVYLYGAGMYNFFYNYDQTCLDTENCQDNMVNVEGNNNLYMFNANTKASVNMVVRETIKYSLVKPITRTVSVNPSTLSGRIIINYFNLYLISTMKNELIANKNGKFS